MTIFRPFNLSSKIARHTEEIAKSIETERALRKQFEEVSVINFIYDGNVQQFKFLMQIANSNLCNRHSLVDSAPKFLTSNDPLVISRYGKAITHAVRNGIHSLERSVNSDLLEPSIFSQDKNLKLSGALRYVLDISIGTDVVQPNSLIATDFFGARFSNAVGSYFWNDQLSVEMRKWVGALVQSLCGYGIGHMGLDDTCDMYHSWYVEEFYSVYSRLLELNYSLLSPLFEYMDSLQDKLEFSLDKFAKLHSQALVASVIPSHVQISENGEYNPVTSDQRYDLSFRKIKQLRKAHATKFANNLKLNFGDNFDTYLSMIEDVRFRKCVEEESSLYFEISEKYSFDHKFHMNKTLLFLLNELPKPSTEHDKKVFEYVTKVLPKAVNHLGSETVGSGAFDCNEQHVMQTVAFGSIQSEFESELCMVFQGHTEMLHEEEEPYSYVRDPKQLELILREHFVCNAILTSIARLASSRGLESFW
ncbi:hypothetical protein [Vibrio sp. 10N.239.312.D08]|uniref:hypothetical protein n=1 Tax=Vibrio sp. 10N.239.312.D08 TaxID=3229978 RepID=UPI0035500F46